MQLAAKVDMSETVAGLTAAILSPLRPQGRLQQFPEEQIVNVKTDPGAGTQGFSLQQIR